MAFTGPIEDRLAIRELYGMQSDGSATRSTENWLACWDEDAVWHTNNFVCTGKAEIRSQWETIWSSFEKVAVLAEVCAIEVAGDVATGRAIAREIVVLKGGGIYKLVGLYRDRFARRGDGWVFTRRDYESIADEMPAA